MMILDLCCKAGGCTRGYQLAGFKVVGLDIKQQKRYIGDDFVVGDAIASLDMLLAGESLLGNCGKYSLRDFVAVSVSPPCQRYSEATRNDNRKKHPDMIGDMRSRLALSGLPYVIENVPGALQFLNDPVVLCGTMFPELRVYRHRLFECSFAVDQPDHLPHNDNCHGNNIISKKGYVNVFGGGGFTKYKRMAMGIDWMTRDELSQAIPPAYTKYIGERLMELLQGANQ